MSVLIRLSGGRFHVDHEVGRGYVTNLGFARPLIGAIFALLLYFAFQGGLLTRSTCPAGAAEFAFFVDRGLPDRLQRALRQGDRPHGARPVRAARAGPAPACEDPPPPAKRTPKKG